MQFVFPSFLFALFALVIPVLIHLFNFRRPKKVIFGDIRFLKAIQEQNKKQRQIRHYLILVSRLFALAALVFAFAKPFIPTEKGGRLGSEQVVSIYLDNSYSMQRKGKEGELVELARKQAQSIADFYGDKAGYQLVTNDFDPRFQKVLPLATFRKAVEEVKISPERRTLLQVHQRQMQLLESAPNATRAIFWLSDFQKNTAPQGDFQRDSLIPIRAVPVVAPQSSNLWIDTVYLDRPVIQAGIPFGIEVVIRYEGSSAMESQPIELSIDGVQKAIQNFTCGPNAMVKVRFETNLNDQAGHRAEVRIHDYPNAFDDVYYFSLKACEKVNVLQVSDQAANTDFAKVYSLDPVFQFQAKSVQQLDFSAFADQQLIILDGLNKLSSGLELELEKYLSQGGTVMFLPTATAGDMSETNRWLQKVAGLQFENEVQQATEIKKLELHDPLFEDVFSKLPEQAKLPTVSRYYPMKLSSATRGSVLIELNNGAPYLFKARVGKGKLFLFASGLGQAQTQFSQHALFVPVMLKLPFQTLFIQPLSCVIGSNVWMNLPSLKGKQVIQLKKNASAFLTETEMLNGQCVYRVPSSITAAGSYDLNNSDQQNIGLLALNDNREESQMECIDPSDIKGVEVMDEHPQKLLQALQKEDQGKELWPLFVALAILFLCLEMLLLRWEAIRQNLQKFTSGAWFKKG